MSTDRLRVRHRPAEALLCLGVALLAIAMLSTSCSSDDSSSSATEPTTSSVAVTPTPTVACSTRTTEHYAQIPGVDPNFTSLEVFTPAAEEDGCVGRPLVVWIHGGGWTSGDRSEYLDDKVALFTGAGFVFAAVNYRLTDAAVAPPTPQYPVHDQDTADAIAWLVEHAETYGIDSRRIAVLGHSAGGGITAAISTDERFLAKHGLPLSTIRCAASMDGEGYDVDAGASSTNDFVGVTYQNAFGTDPAVWAEASPIRHVAAGRGIPKFFIAARGAEWRMEQHNAFIAALDAADVVTTVLDVTTLEHADLTTQIGRPDDTLVTPALMDFLGGCFTSRRR